MQKIGFPAMKSLDQIRSMALGSAKNLSFSSSRQPHDSVSSGNFSNLKFTAEKLVKEQASMKSDLELAPRIALLRFGSLLSFCVYPNLSLIDVLKSMYGVVASLELCFFESDVYKLKFDPCGYENSKLKRSKDHILALEEKLQNAFNENAKLRVMQKEDEKLWRGMESKFSSTKTLCDQLTETLQHLASQVQEAEKDKEFFESKFSTSAETIDSLKQQMQDLSVRLSSAEEDIKSREKELEELRFEKEQKENSYLSEQCRTASLLNVKDATIANSEAAIAEAKVNIENVNFQIEKLRLELTSKEDEAKYLVGVKENLEQEKMDIRLSADNLSEKLINSDQEVKKLEGFIHSLATELGELDKKNLVFMKNFDKLNALYGTHLMLLQKDRDLASDRAQTLFNQLQGELLSVTFQKEGLQSSGNELYEQREELKKAKETLVSQLAEERCSARQTIEKLESEAKCLVSTNAETEAVVVKLKEEIEALLENLRASENKTEELMLKLSSSELESKENYEKFQADAQRKTEEMEILQKESQSNQLRVDSLSEEVNQLQSVIEEKELLIHRCKENEKKLDQKTTEDKELLAAAETKLVEAKKQYALMLENKQLELSRHLKELSQRNDQAINEIRRKYDEEKQEIINAEKEKVEKVIKESSTKYDKELSDCKAESKQQLLTVQEDHASLTLSIQKEHENREFNLKAKHDEELRQAQIQAETELTERITTLRNEHDVELKAFKCQYEDECKKLQDELDLQRSKEERQRALLQMQWRVMSDKDPEEQELNSRKEYSVSSVKVRAPRPASKRSKHATVMQDGDEQDSPFVKAAETPVTKMLKKVENANTRSLMSSQKHHSKVARREYEVETNDGRTTKRRKTGGTVMFEEPRRRSTRITPKAKTPRSIAKVAAIRSHPPQSANLGDLFSEGSLNPYADDPYAFE
uniref:Synaptonemal complex protein 1 n=2 Tax=Brassica campestris TaxID=3711 RepID=M4CHH1_BRACM